VFTFVFFLCVGVLLVLQAPRAEDSGYCNILRKAAATVTVLKIYYEVKEGIPVRNLAKIASNESEVSVWESKSNCTINADYLLKVDNILLSAGGKLEAQSIIVLAFIRLGDLSPGSTTAKKQFYASSWVSSDGGHMVDASASTDLALQEIGLEFEEGWISRKDILDDNLQYNILFHDNIGK
jgi:hypothetical protein